MLVLGILIGTVVGLVLFVSFVAIDEQGQFDAEDPMVRAAISERISPVGQVILLGDAELLARAAVTAAPTPVATTLSGPQVYNAACYLCHSPPGVGGAPLLGDAAAWTDRIEQGRDVLSDHVINGFQGRISFMPPKGGRVDLSDGEIVSAIEYMLDQLPE